MLAGNEVAPIVKDGIHAVMVRALVSRSTEIKSAPSNTPFLQFGEK
jgi:hypothetical protein